MGGITAAALTLASSGIGRGGVDALAVPRGIGLGGDGCRTPSWEAAVAGGGGGGLSFGHGCRPLSWEAAVAGGGGIAFVAIRLQLWEAAVSGGGAG